MPNLSSRAGGEFPLVGCWKRVAGYLDSQDGSFLVDFLLAEFAFARETILELGHFVGHHVRITSRNVEIVVLCSVSCQEDAVFSAYVTATSDTLPVARWEFPKRVWAFRV
eukprot:s553_g12.t1